MKISSNSAILDVKMGRQKLYASVKAGHEHDVVIIGKVNRVFGNDDGESREFVVEVQSVQFVGETP